MVSGKLDELKILTENIFHDTIIKWIFRHNCYDIITLIWHVINKVIDHDMDDVLVFLFSKRAQNISKRLEKAGI